MIQFFLLLLGLFLTGTLIGAGINFCCDRLPLEKSLFWPGFRCGSCYQPLLWMDRIPLVSFWLGGRKCRTCGFRWRWRSLWVEVGTGLAVLALFFLDLFWNVLDIPLVEQHRTQLLGGQVSGPLGLFLLHHVLLVSLLILVSICDLEHMEIPLLVTTTGMVIGVVSSMLVPWPLPGNLPVPEVIHRPAIPGFEQPLAPGAHVWPVWDPLPRWLPPGTWKLGLVSSLAGAIMGMLIVRAVRFLFGVGRGLEGMGLGDADLMMMAGSFVGWQVVLIGFFAAIIPAFFFAIVQIFRRGDEPIPFGPSLGMGVMLVLFGWRWIGESLRPILFDAWALLLLGGLAAVVLLVTAFALRLLRGKGSGIET